MKTLTLVLFLTISLFSNEIEKKELEEKFEKKHLKSLHGKQLSKQEIEYQKYLALKEEENRKLEEDGFCSCNND